MGIAREILLKASHNEWLGRQFQRRAFSRRAARRFMPGEDAASALTAARQLQESGIVTLVTLLGENITTLSEAEAVTAEYTELITNIRSASLDCQLSVKPTQLGIDLPGSVCLDQLVSLAAQAKSYGSRLWIDMESSSYVERTLDLVEAVHTEHANVGVCVQAYLHRTRGDIQRLVESGVAMRLVKGAYKEAPSVALQKKRQVDSAYLDLAKSLLDTAAATGKVFPAFGTHDIKLIRSIQDYATEKELPADDYEFEMLYGIRRDWQTKLVSEGGRVRVLISYGPSWFPWYMRRLAERPANVWFVVRSLVSR
jgi:proline dehydrogenase